MANIRDQGTWCHASDPEGCQVKAADLIASAVAKAHHLEPLEVLKVPVLIRPSLSVEAYPASTLHLTSLMQATKST